MLALIIAFFILLVFALLLGSALGFIIGIILFIIDFRRNPNKPENADLKASYNELKAEVKKLRQLSKYFKPYRKLKHLSDEELIEHYKNVKVLLPDQTYKVTYLGKQKLIIDEFITEDILSKCAELLNRAIGYQRDYVLILSAELAEKFNKAFDVLSDVECTTEEGEPAETVGLCSKVGFIIINPDELDEALFHEIGHSIDNKYKLSRKRKFRELYFKDIEDANYTEDYVFYLHYNEAEFFAVCYQEYIDGELSNEELKKWYELELGKILKKQEMGRK